MQLSKDDIKIMERSVIQLFYDGIKADAHKYQLLYYLYFLKKHAGINAKGILNYPLLKKTVKINLDEKNQNKIQEIIRNVEHIKSLKNHQRLNGSHTAEAVHTVSFAGNDTRLLHLQERKIETEAKHNTA